MDKYDGLESAIKKEDDLRKVDVLFAYLFVGLVEKPKTLSAKANAPQFVSGLSVPRYTENIDALLEVAHKILPKIEKITFEYYAIHVQVNIRFRDKKGVFSNKATAAKALMSAIVLAKQAIEKGEI